MTAQFSPDGKLILAEWLGSAWVWDAQKGKGPMEFRRVSSAQFSPDSSRIVTASEDNLRGYGMHRAANN
jgi:WD40 repeat protein